MNTSLNLGLTAATYKTCLSLAPFSFFAFFTASSLVVNYSLMAIDIQELPVEIHTAILQSAFLNARERHSIELCVDSNEALYDDLDSFEAQPYDEASCTEWKWKERNKRSPSLFPFNAAYVCKMWRDILAGMPGVWTRVVFDLSRDPTPILKAFEWSKSMDHGLEVLIFNSLETEEVCVQEEEERVRDIASALQGHVHRCGSISFDTVYSSSLPLPGMILPRNSPYLGHFQLVSRVDNLTDNMLATALHTATPEFDLHTSPLLLPQLWHLSLTAVTFMNLPDRANFFKALKNQRYLELLISLSEIPMEGPYSLANFLAALASPEVQSSCHRFYLQDVSLRIADDDHVQFLPVAENRPIFTRDLCFYSESRSFIQAFFSLVDVRSDWLSFDGCALPENVQPLESSMLILKNIDEGMTSPATFRQFIDAWSGEHFRLTRCSLFDDDFLSWMLKGNDYALSTAGSGSIPEQLPKPFPAPKMESLSITECGNFSPSVLRQMLHTRWELAQKHKEALGSHHSQPSPRPNDGPVRSVNHLVVIAKEGPNLSDEDLEWFRNNGMDMLFLWEISSKICYRTRMAVDHLSDSVVW